MAAPERVFSSNIQTPGKVAYRRRVRSLCRSQRAKVAARNIAKSWRKTCAAVVAARGAAVKG